MCDQGCRRPTAFGCLNGGSCVADSKKQTSNVREKGLLLGTNVKPSNHYVFYYYSDAFSCDEA